MFLIAVGDEGGDDVSTLLGVVVTVGDSNPIGYDNKLKDINTHTYSF